MALFKPKSILNKEKQLSLKELREGVWKVQDLLFMQIRQFFLLILHLHSYY